MEKVTKAAPKFKTIFLSRSLPKGPRLRQLIRWCGRFHRCGLTPSYGAGSYGNLSMRLKKGSDAFVITVSGIRLKNKLSAKDFFTVIKADPKKTLVWGSGTRPPSSEAMLHEMIYRKRRDVGAVFHGHDQTILQNARALRIPETKKEEAYGSSKLVWQVERILKKRTLLVMKNHGFISLGSSMDRAGNRALGIHRRVARRWKKISN